MQQHGPPQYDNELLDSKCSIDDRFSDYCSGCSSDNDDLLDNCGKYSVDDRFSDFHSGCNNGDGGLPDNGGSVASVTVFLTVTGIAAAMTTTIDNLLWQV